MVLVKCKIYADMILRFRQSDFHVTAEIFFGPYIYIVRANRRGGTPHIKTGSSTNYKFGWWLAGWSSEYIITLWPHLAS